jgi:hypothetical protein
VMHSIDRVLLPPPIFTKEEAIREATAFNESVSQPSDAASQVCCSTLSNITCWPAWLAPCTTRQHEGYACLSL